MIDVTIPLTKWCGIIQSDPDILYLCGLVAVLAVIAFEILRSEKIIVAIVVIALLAVAIVAGIYSMGPVSTPLHLPFPDINDFFEWFGNVTSVYIRVV